MVFQFSDRFGYWARDGVQVTELLQMCCTSSAVFKEVCAGDVEGTGFKGLCCDERGSVV
jgi:hypothetical protein